jgi:hypothetical protein
MAINESSVYYIPRIIYSTENPTINSDSSKGVIPGQIWQHTATKERFMCIDDTVGAAKWYKIPDFIDPDENTVTSFQSEINNNQHILTTPQISYYKQGSIDYNLTIPSDTNAMSVGPITVNSVITVNGTWSVV